MPEAINTSSFESFLSGTLPSEKDRKSLQKLLGSAFLGSNETEKLQSERDELLDWMVSGCLRWLDKSETQQGKFDHLIGRKVSYRHHFSEPRENVIASIKTRYGIRKNEYVAEMADGDTIDIDMCYFSEPIS